MSHLSSERLAAIAAEPPDAAELAHLASCEPCARERTAHQRVLELASAESAMIAAPLTTWETLAPALAAHGLLAQSNVSRRSGAFHHAWLQAAAAVLLVAGGVAGGRYSAGAAIVPTDHVPASPMPAVAVAADSVPRFSSIEEARAAQNQSQMVYQTATAYLAQRDTSNQVIGSPSDMRRRLAALDQVSQTMGAALEDAPYDPVINGYYLTTLGQREATLRQLNTALPVGVRITSY